jgi:hypothetical protein
MKYWKYISSGFLFALAHLHPAIASEDRYALPRMAIHDKTDQRQRIIDLWDGTEDQKIFFNDPVITEKSTYTYIQLIDSIQEWMELPSRTGFERYQDALHLQYLTEQITPTNYHLVDHFKSVFENMLSILRHKEDPEIMTYLLRNMQASIENIALYKDHEVAGRFLLHAATLYPNEILKEINYFYKKEYALAVVEKVAKVSPQSLKKYFTGKNLVNALLLESKDPVVTLLIDLFRKYGPESKVYYFIDLIFHDKIEPDLFHQLYQYPRQYLEALIVARQKKDPIGGYDLERELSVRALEEVRKVNDLHDLTDSTKRFAAVRNMGARELYTLIVYSPEEIFTSTFNGMFERLLFHMKNEGMNGYYLLEQVNYNRFRTFIKLCAGYNALGKFLSTMPKEQSTEVLKLFVSSLNPDDGNLSEAVNVADTFGSLDDITYLRIFEEYLKEEFYKQQDNRDIRLLYGLLLKLLYQKSGFLPDQELADELAAYTLPSIEKIPVSMLADEQRNTTQLHFFFDDEDGITSYSTFIAAFKTAGFSIEEQAHYVIIRGKGKNSSVIYANKPLSEREGQSQLTEMMHNGIIQPSVVVHRGHSYYAMNTIQVIPPYAKIVFLGSCGGYHNLSEVLKRASDAHIISSKQIGTYIVNNQLLVDISKTIKDQEILDWSIIWKQMDAKFKGSGKSYERFQDYVPPHKNMGALFIQAFQKNSQYDEG